MIRYVPETVAGEKLFEYLPESMLNEIVSDPDHSIYVFICGCVAVRAADSATCRMQWCRGYRNPS